MKITEKHIHFIFSRSSGPGGQNVNKVNTQVTAILDLLACEVFSGEQKELLFKNLSNRIDKQGKLQLTSNRYRSQQSNRQDVLERMNQLLVKALIKPKIRKSTKISNAAKQRRLKAKKMRSEVKKYRSRQIES